MSSSGLNPNLPLSVFISPGVPAQLVKQGGKDWYMMPAASGHKALYFDANDPEVAAAIAKTAAIMAKKAAAESKPLVTVTITWVEPDGAKMIHNQSLVPPTNPGDTYGICWIPAGSKILSMDVLPSGPTTPNLHYSPMTGSVTMTAAGTNPFHAPLPHVRTDPSSPPAPDFGHWQPGEFLR